MSKLYLYIDENCRKEAEKYLENLTDEKLALFFIGESYDETKLKIELNHIVSVGSKLVCVFFGNPHFDSGISMQMGLAKKIYDGPGAEEELAAFLNTVKKPKGKLGLVIGIIIGLIMAEVYILFKPKKEIKENTAEAVTEIDNLSLSEVYLKALIENGADCIAVDGRISEEEMLCLESLDLSGLGLEDLKPLLYAGNLKRLDISDNNISDITELAALGKLESLDISNNPVKNYEILDYLPNLKDVVK